MQERFACAKEQIYQLEGKVNAVCKDLSENIKTAQIIRSQLGITEFLEYDQCKELTSCINEQLVSLSQALNSESSLQNRDFANNAKEIRKLRIEKRNILDDLKLLESRVTVNEENIGVYLDYNNNEFE